MQPVAMTPSMASSLALARHDAPPSISPDKPESAREAFENFFGETFYGQMMKSLRQMTDKPAYFHGGRAEEIFQGQLDQIFATEMTKSTAGQLTGPMFDVFAGFHRK